MQICTNFMRTCIGLMQNCKRNMQFRKIVEAKTAPKYLIVHLMLIQVLLIVVHKRMQKGRGNNYAIRPSSYCRIQGVIPEKVWRRTKRSRSSSACNKAYKVCKSCLRQKYT